MADKVNMSLDEIIQASKTRRDNEASGSRKSFPKKQGARLSTGRGRAVGRPGGMRTNFSKKIVKKAVQNLNNRGNAARRNVNADSGMIPRSEVKNIINKAVKQAMKQQNAKVGIAGRLGGGKMPRNIITATKLAQLSQRSRTIQRNRVAPVMRQRGRGFAQPAVQYVEEVVSPQPVRIIRQPVQAPVVQVVERVVPARQQFRKQFVGGRGGAIARVGGGGRIVRQTPAVQRVVQQQQRIIQRPAQQQRFVQRPAQQQRFIQRPVQQQRIIRQPQQIVYEQPAQQRVQVIRRQPQVQRVQVVRQAPVQQRVQVIRRQPQVQVVRQNAPQQRGNRQNVQYVEYTSVPNAARNKNDRMRNALGLGTPRHVVREAQRFEPSSSFLANRTVSNVRGRGFSGRRNDY